MFTTQEDFVQITLQLENRLFPIERMTDNEDVATATQIREAEDKTDIIGPNQDFELGDARRNVTTREDVPPDGGKLSYFSKI